MLVSGSVAKISMQIIACSFWPRSISHRQQFHSTFLSSLRTFKHRRRAVGGCHWPCGFWKIQFAEGILRRSAWCSTQSATRTCCTWAEMEDVERETRVAHVSFYHKSPSHNSKISGFTVKPRENR